MTATKIQPGDDTHLTLLMAPHSLNFVTGADRAALLAYGREVFAAGREAKCLAQIQEPEAPAAVAPFGYVNTHTGQFFTDVEPCRQGNEGHWRTVYLQPAAVAGPAWSEQQVHALAIHMAESAPPSHKPRDYDADMAWARSALGFIAGHAPAAPALEAPAAPDLRKTRDKAGILHYLTPEQMAEEIVRLDARLAAAPQAPALEAPAAPMTTAEACAALAINSALHRIRVGNATGAIEPLEQARAALAAAPQAPAAPSADERTAYVEFLAGKFPQTYSKEDAEHWWDHGHVSALTWKAARSTRAAPAAPAVDAQGERDAAFEAVRQRLCRIPRWSFHIDSRGNIRRVDDASGNWIEFSAAHQLFDPVAMDAALAAQAKEGGA